MTAIKTIEIVKDSEIRAKMEDLKHDYCDDKIENEEYLQSLKSLLEVCNDTITRSQIKYRIMEVEGSIERGN
jgi:DNA-binding transcriptional regulator WhiA